MEIFVKDNGIKEPLLPNFSIQPNMSEKDENSMPWKSRNQYEKDENSAPKCNLNQPKAKQKDLHPELPFKNQSNCPTLVQAGLILSIYLGVGMICSYNLRHQVSGLKTSRMVDALYFCIITMTTAGYGDLTPNGVLVKLFVCAYVFLGIALMSLLLSVAADYLVEKQERLLLKAFHKHQNPVLDELPNEKQIHRAKWKLLLSVAILLALIVVGIVFLHKVEGLDLFTSFFCVCSTITTLGYGYQSFSTEGGRIFASFWILVSTLFLAQCFLYIAELRTEDRQQALVRWVLTRKMTSTDLEAADLDSDGVVSASEFVIYKLKEMGKIEEEDMALLMKVFRELDVDHSGTLTLSDLNLAQQAPEN